MRTESGFVDREDAAEFLTSYGGSKGETVAAVDGTDKRIVLELIPATSD